MRALLWVVGLAAPACSRFTATVDSDAAPSPDSSPEVDSDVPSLDTDVADSDAAPVDPETTLGCPDDVGGDMVLIRAGTFLSGPSALPLAIDHDYCIDLRELTVAHWNACVEAGGCTGYDGWASCQSDPPAANAPNQCFDDRDDHGANWIDWDRALAYCTWAGKRLALPEEWERAARGEDGRKYPWGNVFSCTKTHAERGSVFNACAGEGGFPDAPVPVGSYPSGASPHGLLDASGNLKEWVEHRPDPSVPPVAGEYALAMGGAYTESSTMVYAYSADGLLGVGITSRQHGIRCAADPVQVPVE